MKLKSVIKDPDLFQLFQNAFPNTLDTTVKWRGMAQNDTTEDVAFLVTGDIDAMWLRDSANQMHPYAFVLKPSSQPGSLASLFRGNINLQARSIAKEPWCNSYQAPPESGIRTSNNGGAYTYTPQIDMNFCFTPNFELDSYGAFFLTSWDYYSATKDGAFFGRYQWIDAVKQILRVAKAQMDPFYNEVTGEPLTPAYTFTSQTRSFTGSLGLGGLGNPVNFTGMVKAPFRPSDDSSIYQFLIPSNMMFSSFLEKGAEIMRAINNDESKQLAGEMLDMSKSIRAAIEKYGVVPHPDGSGKSIYAFEVDGYGGRNLMDDANIPSLVSAPLLLYVQSGQKEYQTYLNTREFVTSLANPWYSKGPVITGTGSPHTSTGKTWPMALMATVLTSNDDAEIISLVKQLVSSTGGLGLMHESVNSRNEHDWTRQW